MFLIKKKKTIALERQKNIFQTPHDSSANGFRKICSKTFVAFLAKIEKKRKWKKYLKLMMALHSHVNVLKGGAVSLSQL